MTSREQHGGGTEGRAERLQRLDPQQRAAFIERTTGRSRPVQAAAIPRRPGDELVPLSYSQQRLWFLDQLSPGNPAFNEYVALRLAGPIEPAPLEHALSALVRRHEALRTVVDPATDPPSQIVRSSAGPVMRVVDIGDDPECGVSEQDLATQEAARPFDLCTGPLLRALLIRSGPERALLVVVNHHIVGDAWSRSIMVQDLCAEYRAFQAGRAGPAAAQSTSYADWVLWQRRQLTDDALAAQLAYWRGQLADAPPLLSLPADRPRPATPSHHGGRLHFSIGVDATRALEELARSCRATPFMVTLAAWQAMLKRYCGHDDIVVGVPTSGRDHPQVERVVGMFINALVIRSDLSADPTFAELIERVRNTTLDAFANAKVPFERLVHHLRPARDLSYTPIFQTQLGYRNVPAADLTLPGLRLEPVELDNGTCRNDLSVELARNGPDTAGICEFSRDLFDEATARALVDSFAEILRRGAAAPQLRLSELIGLTSDERAMLDTAGTGPALPGPPEDLLTSFDRVARTRPDADAIVLASASGETTLSYAQLSARVGWIADQLRDAGIRSGDRVGICLRRGIDLPASMLAVLAAGAAYVPLDPDYPAARLDYVMGDAGLAAVLASAATHRLVPAGLPVVRLDAPAAEVPKAPARLDRPGAWTDDAIAYVIYTSGSTGAPKGVMVRRRNLAAFLTAMDALVSDASETPITWLAVTSAAFDIAVLELLWTLSRGHRVILAPDEKAEDSPSLTTGAAQRAISLFFFASDTSAVSPGAEQYRLLLEAAQFADSQGFAAVWLPERHFHPFGGAFPAPSVLAAALAQCTRRIGIRAGSVVIPLHQAVRVAEEWSVVDNLSGGRVGLSFASGWHVDDFVLAPDSYESRRERMTELIDQVRRLWRGERLLMSGPNGRSIQVGTLPRPVQPELPFWITSSGSAETFRRAGELGARLLTHLLGQNKAELAERLTVYRDSYRAAGHPGEPYVTLMLHAYVGQDQADIDAHARGPFREYLRSSADLIGRTARAQGAGPETDGVTSDDLEALLDHACERYLREASLIGTADQCQAMLRELDELDLDEIACLIDFGVPTDQALSGLRRLAGLRAGPPQDQQGRALGTTRYPELIRRYAVTHLQCTPSLARALLDGPDPQALGELTQVLLGGEALPADLVRQLRRLTSAQLVNMYGPTETTVYSTGCALDPASETVTIGTPIAGTTLRIVDDSGQQVPPGVLGELWIGGAGVSAGYLERPELTAERFPADPDADWPGARLYKTGDIVRMRRDGQLEYLHRNDDQVKVRGFRVELGEIENELLGLAEVRDCAVAVYQSGTGQAGLAAYVILAPQASFSPARLRAALADLLPGHLVPTRFTAVAALPRTPNGKLDRAALVADRQVSAPAPAAADVSPTEARITRIWEETLDGGQIGLDDDFFEAGGHSLLAIQVIARIRRELGADLPLRTLFAAPSVAQLAREVDALTTRSGGQDIASGQRALARADGPPAVAEAARDSASHESFPLTDVQQAYWVGRHASAGPPVSCYLYLELDVPALDTGRLESCWNSLVRRHDALHLVIDDDGSQRVLPEAPAYRIGVRDFCDLSEDTRQAALRAIREEMSHQVLPADRFPLFDLRVSQIGAGQSRLHLGVDTLIADGGSVRILLRELLAAYQGMPDPPPLTLSFRGHVMEQQARRAGPDYDRDLAYWQDRAAQLPPAPRLPLARQLADLERIRFRRRETAMPAQSWSALKARAAKARVTPSALALAAYAAIIGTWSASDQFTLNLTLLSRDAERPDLAGLVGDFTTLVLLGVEGATTGSFTDRARRLQERLWEDLDHRLVSGVHVARQLARQRGAGQAAMPVVFTSELGNPDTNTAELLSAMDATASYTITQTPQIWLDHQIAEDDGVLRLTWDSVDELFPAGMIDNMFAAYVGLLEDLATDSRAWTDPAYLPQAAVPAHAYQALNDTAGPVPPGLLHEGFTRQAEHHPERTAVVDASGQLSYGDLLAAADTIACALDEAGVRPGAVVGVLATRDRHQVAAVLGVLLAGCAFLPLDQQLPAARIARSLRHAQAAALVAHDLAPAAAVPGGCPVILVGPALAAGRRHAPSGVRASETDPAYVIYTSGSTGEPKGVMISHQAALNTIADISERFGVGPHDRVLGLSSLGFDLAIYDLFGTLAAGAALVLAGPGTEHDPVSWARLITQDQVTIWNSVPALMEMLLMHGSGRAGVTFGQLRLILLSGDWIPTALPGRISELAPHALVVSLGGATEVSIWSVVHRITPADRARTSIPYGQPLRNQRAYVCDEMLRPRPLGVPGMLYLAGTGVALGYLGDEPRTSVAFPVHPVTGERLYRTGDLARLLPDGELEFLGREDSQVKINGMRIELGEIETALTEIPGVREAAVVVEGDRTSARLAG